MARLGPALYPRRAVRSVCAEAASDQHQGVAEPRRARARANRVEGLHRSLQRRGQPAPAEGHRVQLRLEPGTPSLRHQAPGGQRDVVGGSVHGRGRASPVGEGKAEADWMPQPRLDRHERATGTQQSSRLGEARSDRSLEGDVVKDEAVQDDVEAGVRELERSRMTEPCLVGAAGRDYSGDALGVRVDGGEPERRRGKQVPARVPARSHRQNVAPGQTEPTIDQRALTRFHVAVVQLEGGAPGEAVEQVRGVIGLGPDPPPSGALVGSCGLAGDARQCRAGAWEPSLACRRAQDRAQVTATARFPPPLRVTARSAMPAAPDVAIVSLGTTMGWRHADAALARMLEQAGCSCEVRPVQLGRAAVLRRSMMLTDTVEAAAARRAAAGVKARAIIFSSITAALLQRPRLPYAVRFDTVAALSRPGAGGAWQRWREPAVLARARLLLPWGEAAAHKARELVAGRATAPGFSVVALPVPIEHIPAGQARDVDAVAYAGNPDKRRLDLLCAAWRQAATPGSRLIVGGIERSAAVRWLRARGLDGAEGVEWAGALPRERWLELVARARVFVNASAYEDWGIAQLEALAAGTPLATVPTPGPNEALALARRLAPELVAVESSAAALAAAIGAGLALSPAARAAYADRAEAMLLPYRPEAVRSLLVREVVPALLRSSA